MVKLTQDLHFSEIKEKNLEGPAINWFKLLHTGCRLSRQGNGKWGHAAQGEIGEARSCWVHSGEAPLKWEEVMKRKVGGLWVGLRVPGRRTSGAELFMVAAKVSGVAVGMCSWSGSCQSSLPHCQGMSQTKVLSLTSPRNSFRFCLSFFFHLKFLVLSNHHFLRREILLLYHIAAFKTTCIISLVGQLLPEILILTDTSVRLIAHGPQLLI